MSGGFKPEDKYSWYFGSVSRDESRDMLKDEIDGTFFVRDSQRMKGDYVLVVQESGKISHYIINCINQDDQSANINHYKIGDQEFKDIPSLLNFYKTHYLDTTALIKPVPREKVLCKYDFAGRDPEDLPFKRGEVLEIIQKDEEKWWSARNKEGKIGQIPVTYVETNYNDRDRSSKSPHINQTPEVASNLPIVPSQINLPAMAVALQDRIPNAYDKSQLKFDKGDIIKVTEVDLNGQWCGELKGKSGYFPFTMVRIMEQNN